MLVTAASQVGLGFAQEYARYALLTRPGALPFGLAFGWLTLWLWMLFVGPVIVIMPLLFPTGRLLSPGWRWVAWPAAACMAGIALAAALRPGPLDGLEPVPNPLGLAGAASVLLGLEQALNLALAPLTLLATLSLLLRFARSRGDERAQLKWFLYVAAVFLLYILHGILADTLGLFPELPAGVGSVVFPLFLGLFALAIGIAVLKYRLYDIDVIIRRTLVYGVLTALLALVYFSTVAVLQGVVTAIGGQPSAVGIVISTLAIAALFSPLRRRVQNLIDRRFYRRKYDAARTLADFGATARDETDLDRLAGRLISVVNEAIQPSQAFLWLKHSVREGER
jgi:hypothetical protein